MALNTSFTTGAVLTAAQMNNLPWGVAGKAKRTSNFTLSTTSTAVTDLTVTWTADSTRLYKITTAIYVNVITGSGSVFSSIFTSAGSRVAEFGNYGAAGSYISITAVAYESGLSGSQTRRVQANYTGVSSANIIADPGYPSVIIVEDIGAA